MIGSPAHEMVHSLGTGNAATRPSSPSAKKKKHWQVAGNTYTRERNQVKRQLAQVAAWKLTKKYHELLLNLPIELTRETQAGGCPAYYLSHELDKKRHEYMVYFITNVAHVVQVVEGW
jgi:hypothetical protein